jgi:hypothetical protein
VKASPVLPPPQLPASDALRMNCSAASTFLPSRMAMLLSSAATEANAQQLPHSP